MEKGHATRGALALSNDGENALSRAIDELRIIDKETAQIRAHLSSLDKKAERIRATIGALSNKSVPPTDVESRKPPYVGEVYSNVIELFRTESSREWSAPEIKKALERKGVAADTNRVHNTLAYLAREGKLLRISRGKYLVIPYGFGYCLSLKLRRPQRASDR